MWIFCLKFNKSHSEVWQQQPLDSMVPANWMILVNYCFEINKQTVEFKSVVFVMKDDT